MRVKANRKGFDGIQIVEKDTEFTVPDGTPQATWWDVLEGRPGSPVENKMLSDFERLGHVDDDDVRRRRAAEEDDARKRASKSK